MFKDLKEKIANVYLIKCCQIENNSCETCKKFYGNLKWCPKSYADDISEAINNLENNMKYIDLINGKL